MHRTITIALALSLMMSGCSYNRSISNQGYAYGMQGSGELSQLAIMEAMSAETPTGTIAKVAPGDRVMVVQSGQIVPDAAMLGMFGTEVTVLPVSGITAKAEEQPRDLVRLGRAGSIAKMLFYWGNIETHVEAKGTASVSWVPVVGMFVPDRDHDMRLTVSALYCDVAAGRWELIEERSEPVVFTTAGFWRESRDADVIARLKSEVYRKIVQRIGPTSL